MLLMLWVFSSILLSGYRAFYTTVSCVFLTCEVETSTADFRFPKQWLRHSGLDRDRQYEYTVVLRTHWPSIVKGAGQPWRWIDDRRLGCHVNTHRSARWLLMQILIRSIVDEVFFEMDRGVTSTPWEKLLHKGEAGKKLHQSDIVHETDLRSGVFITVLVRACQYSLQ